MVVEESRKWEFAETLAGLIRADAYQKASEAGFILREVDLRQAQSSADFVGIIRISINDGRVNILPHPGSNIPNY